MTTILTRVFHDEKAAKAAKSRAVVLGVPNSAVSVITSESSDTDTLIKQMRDAQVHESAIGVYADHLEKGHALFVARTTYKPLTAAAIVRKMLAKHDVIETKDVMDDFFVPDTLSNASSVMDTHPLFLTVSTARHRRQGMTGAFGFPLLSTRKDRNSASRTGSFMSRLFWPMSLLSRKPRKISAMRGGRTMASSFWPMPLLSTSKRSNSVIRGGDLPFSRSLGWPPVA